MKILFKSLLGFFLILGLVQTFLYSPFQIPDEPDHWKSAVIRAERGLSSERKVCSQSLGLASLFDFERIIHHEDQKTDPKAFSSLSLLQSVCSEVDVTYGSVLSYPGASFAHLFFGKADKPRAHLNAFYMGRILQGGLVFISLALLVISVQQPTRVVSALSLVLLLFLALTPKFVQQSFAVSTDIVVNAFAISLGSLFFPRPMGRWRLIWLAFIGVCALSTKPILMPVVLPAVLWVVFRDSADKRWSRDNRTLLALGGGLSWVGVYFGLSAKAVTTVTADVHPALQLQHILSNPLSTIPMIVWAPLKFLQRHYWLIDQLGWRDFDSSHDTAVTLLILLLVSFALVGVIFWGRGPGSRIGNLRHKLKLYWNQKTWIATDLLFLLGVLASSTLISLFLYLAWTPVGAPRVDGLQGRYIFPQVFLVLCWFFSKLERLQPEAVDLPPLGKKARTGFWLLYGFLVFAFLQHLSLRAMDLLSRYG